MNRLKKIFIIALTILSISVGSRLEYVFASTGTAVRSQAYVFQADKFSALTATSALISTRKAFSSFGYLALKKRQLQRNKFVGDWIFKLVNVSNDCPMLSNPDAFNSSIGISDKLIGTDYVDKTPLFKGKVERNRIVFKRSRSVADSMQTQTLIVTSRNRGNAKVALSIQTESSEFSCSLEYEGTGIRAQ